MHIRERSRTSVEHTTRESERENEERKVSDSSLFELEGREGGEKVRVERTDVEASGSEDTRDSRENSRLVLDETVEDVPESMTRRRMSVSLEVESEREGRKEKGNEPLEGLVGRRRGVVEDAQHMILSTFRGLVEDRKGRRSRVVSLKLVWKEEDSKRGKGEKGNGVKVSFDLPSFLPLKSLELRPPRRFSPRRAETEDSSTHNPKQKSSRRCS